MEETPDRSPLLDAAEFLDPAIATAIFEKNPDAILIVNGKGQIVRANERVELLFGYHRSEMRGQAIEMLIPENIREKHKHHRSKFAEDPRPRSMGLGLELSARRKDGTAIPVEINLSPVTSVNGPLTLATIRRKASA